jgi:type IV secretion system protein TrbE
VLNLRRWLRDYESRARTLTDVMPWVSCLAPDVVLCKDGGLLACFRLSGMDVEAADPAEVDACAARLEHALRSFDERFVLWSTIHRRAWRPPEPDRFPDAISARLERAHLDQLRGRPMYENRHFLSIFRRPPPPSERLVAATRTGAARGARHRFEVAWEAVAAAVSYERAWSRHTEALADDLDRFREALDAFQGAAPAIGLRRLEATDLLAFLHDCCSPGAAGQPVASPAAPGLLDAALCDNSVAIGSRVLRFDAIDPLYCAALTLRQWPDSTHPGLLDGLLSTAGEIAVSQAFRFVDREAAAKHILSVERFNLNLQKRWTSYVREAVAGEESAVRDGGRAIAAADAADALTEMTESNRS